MLAGSLPPRRADAQHRNIFEVALSRAPGRVAERHRLSRSRLLPFLAQQPPAIVLMEACGSAHHWGRQFQELGHTVVPLPAHHVRKYRQGRSKTDRTDAKSLLEAFRNEEIRPVPVKTVEQQSLLALHRLRSGWLHTRTARINAARGILRELGLTLPLGARQVRPRLLAILADGDSPLAPPLRQTLGELADEMAELERRIASVEIQLRALARAMPTVRRLLTIPGIGLLTATALVASVGNVDRFASGRHFASYLGLTPRESQSGERRHLGRISKAGDSYLRMLLTHGARAVLLAAKSRKDPDRLRTWALEVEHRRGHNRATIALANKLARIAWAVWFHDRDFQSQPNPLSTHQPAA